MSSRVSRVSRRVRLPDGAVLGTWSITFDSARSNNNGVYLEGYVMRSGVVSWEVERGERVEHWECHFSLLRESDTLIEPAYDEPPTLVEISEGITQVWP